MKLEVTYAREALPERAPTLAKPAPRNATKLGPTTDAPPSRSEALPDAVLQNEPDATPSESLDTDGRAQEPKSRVVEKKGKPKGTRRTTSRAEAGTRAARKVAPVSMRAAIRGALALPMDLAAAQLTKKPAPRNE